MSRSPSLFETPTLVLRKPETMSPLTIKRITVGVMSLLATALFGFCALFVQVDQALAHSRHATARVLPAADGR